MKVRCPSTFGDVDDLHAFLMDVQHLWSTGNPANRGKLAVFQPTSANFMLSLHVLEQTWRGNPYNEQLGKP